MEGKCNVGKQKVIAEAGSEQKMHVSEVHALPLGGGHEGVWRVLGQDPGGGHGQWRGWGSGSAPQSCATLRDSGELG